MRDSFFESARTAKFSSCRANQLGDFSLAIALEAHRLALKYNKDSFECEDLQQILCVGRDNVRTLMNESDFPSIQVGNRKIVPAIALAGWLLRFVIDA